MHKQTALQRVGVRRLLLLIKKVLNENYPIMDGNMVDLRESKKMVISMLSQLQEKQLIEDWHVKFDGLGNMKMEIKPNQAPDFVELQLILTIPLTSN